VRRGEDLLQHHRWRRYALVLRPLSYSLQASSSPQVSPSSHTLGSIVPNPRCDPLCLPHHCGVERAEEVLAGRPEKPAASIFLKACEMVGVQPSEAVHVGDSLKADIAGGNGAGLTATVFVSASGAAAPADGPQPTFTVCLSGGCLSLREGYGSRTARRLKRRGVSLLLLCGCGCVSQVKVATETMDCIAALEKGSVGKRFLPHDSERFTEPSGL